MHAVWYAVFVGAVILLYRYAVDSEHRIPVEEARWRLRAREFDVVVDVRTAVERNMLGYVPGSIHIPAADLEREIQRRFPSRQTRILLYCNTGQRARRAADILHALGYTNTQYIASSHVGLL